MLTLGLVVASFSFCEPLMMLLSLVADAYSVLTQMRRRSTSCAVHPRCPGRTHIQLHDCILHALANATVSLLQVRRSCRLFLPRAAVGRAAVTGAGDMARLICLSLPTCQRGTAPGRQRGRGGGRSRRPRLITKRSEYDDLD